MATGLGTSQRLGHLLGSTGKGTLDIYISASSWIITSEVLRYGTCSPGISQFYLHTHTFIHNRNEPYLPCLPSYNWYEFTSHGGMEGWVGLGDLLCSETVYHAQWPSPIPLATGLNVEQLCWSRPTRYRYTKPLRYLFQQSKSTVLGKTSLVALWHICQQTTTDTHSWHQRWHM